MKNKDFDCVEMKNKIQEKLIEERKQYASDEEYQKVLQERLLNDPKYGDFYKKLLASKNRKKEAA